jgi:AraC family transcriptional regulator
VVSLQELETSEAKVEWINRVIDLLNLVSRQLDGRSASVQFALIQATALLKEQVGKEPRVVDPKARRGLLPWQVRKVREFIDHQLSNRLRISDLSAIVQMSEAHFSRLFKLALGESPHAFILRRRLELAARLMIESVAPLSEIALQCGFTDQAHLSKQFRQAFRESPAAWRRAQGGGMLPGGSGRALRLDAAAIHPTGHSAGAA